MRANKPRFHGDRWRNVRVAIVSSTQRSQGRSLSDRMTCRTDQRRVPATLSYLPLSVVTFEKKGFTSSKDRSRKDRVTAYNRASPKWLWQPFVYFFRCSYNFLSTTEVETLSMNSRRTFGNFYGISLGFFTLVWKGGRRVWKIDVMHTEKKKNLLIN